MINVGFFSEMKISMCDSGSIKKYLADTVTYDKDLIIKYLSSFGRQAICPRYAIDCVTGETISTCFVINNDEKYCWPDFLIYHIQHYPIILPDDFVEHIMSKMK